MLPGDEIIFESHFQSENMDAEERNLCLWLLNNSQEVQDSPRRLNSDKPFNLVTMYLLKEDGVIGFSGAISNGDENKWIDGTITDRPSFSGTSKFIKCKVHRLADTVLDQDKDYYLEEEFITFPQHIVRKTKYTFGPGSELKTCTPLPVITQEVVSDFIQETTDEIKLRMTRTNND